MVSCLLTRMVAAWAGRLSETTSRAVASVMPSSSSSPRAKLSSTLHTDDEHLPVLWWRQPWEEWWS